jgi:hypothetical protein
MKTVTILSTIMLASSALASEKSQFHLLESNPLDFAAPVVYSRANVTEAGVGTIVFDSSAGGFFGLALSGSPSSATSWITLGSAPSEVWLTGSNSTSGGYGTTNTAIRRFLHMQKNVGTAITYSDDAAAGDSFTVNQSGVYTISYQDVAEGNNCFPGVSVNSTQLSTDIDDISASTRVLRTTAIEDNDTASSVTLNLNSGDVVRAHTYPYGSGDNCNGTADSDVSFRVVLTH